ncbi:hypothetical protein A5624_10295 [Mycobacterium sp. 1482292.6]|uniref:DoxX family protein n=1 Tax=unclassified Mycobacterium TaxID=2642494 RepID=UPI000802442D|nr:MULTISPECIES: DoxX family protein [unclassified Mycobacterium]OBJ12639.1 hypothetical protein A5624_10295 [Mycobacterium sp. 1482292.6]OBJ13320.1 hypothetical protein A5622_06295 [Mycobacterium sp. 1245801.1]
MKLAYTIVTIALSVSFLVFGIAKLLRVPAMRNLAEHVNFSVNSYVLIGMLELAAAAGLLIGFAYRPLGIAAAGGLFLLMLGAIVVLVRNGDKPKDWAPALVFGVLSAATAGLAIAA